MRLLEVEVGPDDVRRYWRRLNFPALATLLLNEYLIQRIFSILLKELFKLYNRFLLVKKDEGVAHVAPLYHVILFLKLYHGLSHQIIVLVKLANVKISLFALRLHEPLTPKIVIVD